MNKQKISLILLIIFAVITALTLANSFLDETNTIENKKGTLTIANKTVNYDNAGKCVEVIDGNTIQVYGVGRVQLTQVSGVDKEPTFSQAKNFVSDNCLGKTVYLDIDDKNPKDKFDRTLAIVYTDDTNINRELLENDMARMSYFTPTEFEKIV
jgi:micrococcal nuclease